MAVNEQIITGRKFRKLINETTKLWQRISFWTKASDVEFDDGKTAETKLGAINGITSDLSCTDESIAASMASVGRSLTANGNKFYFDYKDGKYGYNTDPNRGADTFSPFSSGTGTNLKIRGGTSSTVNPTNATGSHRYYNESGMFKYLVITDYNSVKPTVKLDSVAYSYKAVNELIPISSVNEIMISQGKNTSGTGGTVSMSWTGYLLIEDKIPSE